MIPDMLVFAERASYRTLFQRKRASVGTMMVDQVMQRFCLHFLHREAGHVEPRLVGINAGAFIVHDDKSMNGIFGNRPCEPGRFGELVLHQSFIHIGNAATE
nr:hypothetical protein [Noviherbaspirillum sp.]